MQPMPTPTLTADDLLHLPRGPQRCELVRGELHTMSPAGPRHGKVAARFGKILMMHVDRHHLGDVYASDTGFLLERDPDTVMAPDLAFVAATRTHLAPERGWFPGPPDLCVEVRSPRDRAADLEAKAVSWLGHGCRCVITVDPGSRTATVHRRGAAPRLLTEADTLDADDVVPGFRMAIADLFAP
jgi:Uma2 family endonuclease